MSKLNLSEKSKNYYEENDIYEIFSIAEDYPNKIYNYLNEKLKNKTILDLGCGTGKFMEKFHKNSLQYIGLDLSDEQLNIAKTKIKSNKVQYICSSAENIPLPPNSVDVVIATWVLGTILETDRRNKVVKELKRVVRENGIIYLVENDIGGEFEEIRNRYPDYEKTKQYNDWIEENGFEIADKFCTNFQFENQKQAKSVFTNIWGVEIGNKIQKDIISHNIVIYEYFN